MSLSNLVGRYLTPRGDENLPVWDGRRRGHYEVWYLTLNAPEDDAAFWLRYTLDAPDKGEAHGELWGHFFDARDPERRFGLRRRFTGTGLKVGRAPLIQLGEAALHEGRAYGKLEEGGHALEWDLQFTRSPWAIGMMPFWLRGYLGRKRTTWGVPNADVRFSGRVVADGRTFTLEEAPGQQAHLYGRRHADRWAWTHCNTFEGHPGTVLEGVAAETVLGGVRKLFTLIYLRHEGVDYLCNALPGPALFAKSRIDFPQWEFRCAVDGTELVGTVRGAPDRMLQVRYQDPDGTPSYCSNTELAELRLELRRGGRTVEVLQSPRTAHVEFGQRQRRDQVRLGVGS